MEQILLNKTLEELEKKVWDMPETFPTPLIEKVYSLRKVKLADLDSEDLRILLGQGVGLKYVVHLAMNQLSKNLLVEARYFPGDLLLALLKVESNFWNSNSSLKDRMTEVLHNASEVVDKSPEINDEIKNNLKASIQFYSRNQ